MLLILPLEHLDAQFENLRDNDGKLNSWVSFDFLCTTFDIITDYALIDIEETRFKEPPQLLDKYRK